MNPSAAARALILLMPLACAGASAGLPEVAAQELAALAAPSPEQCPAAQAAGADAAALGLAGVSFEARGQDLAALSALAPAGPRVTVGAAAPGARGEVAGLGFCDGARWGQIAAVAPAAGQVARVRVVPLAPQARAAMDRGLADLQRGHGPEARVAFGAAAAIATTAVPGPGLAVARSYTAEGRWDEAAAVYQEVAGRFDANPIAHAGLADVLRRTGKRLPAVAAWARALASWPANDPLLRQLAADPFIEVHPFVPPPAWRLPDGRWTLIPGRPGREGAPETAAFAQAEAAAYATCKEAFRAAGAWRWSPAEESVCTAVWLTSYVRHRETGRTEDEALDHLLLVARQGFLDERSFFDVGARAHPLAPALLDAPSRARLLEFVTTFRVMHRRGGGWLL